MTIAAPYLLYLGHCADFAGIKTSRGLAVFRPEACVGEYRHDDCPLTLGLDRLTFEQAAAQGARTLVLGIANSGGTMGPDLIADALAAIGAGLNVAAGLHQRLRDVAALRDAAAQAGVQLFDVRDPPADLPVGTGEPRAGRRVLTVGTDCSVGKMYTSLALTEALRARGETADFRATGQTGILVAGAGVPIDAVVADFIAGAAEWLSPARDDGGWDVIEGQGSLSHPSFAGVSTGLLHGAQAEALVVCHDPLRTHMRGLPGRALPDLGETIAMNLAVGRLTSPDIRAAGICLNSSAMDAGEAEALCRRLEDEHGLPASDPMRFGLDGIVDRLLA